MNKVGIIWFCVGLLAQISFACATPPGADNKPLHQYIEPTLGTKCPYIPPEQPEPPPDNCTLVHINHLGRHGSRHPGDGNVWLKDFLKPAEALGFRNSTGNTLTPKGQQLTATFNRLNALYSSPKSPAGSITLQGEQELAGIAQRMITSSGLESKEFLKQLQQHSSTAKSTFVHRTQTSRAAFLNSWKDTFNSQTPLNITLKTPQKGDIDTELVFYYYCKETIEIWERLTTAYKGQTNAILNAPGVREKILRFAHFFMADPDNKQSETLSELAYRLCALDSNQNYSLGICQLLMEAPEYQTIFQVFGRITSIKQFYSRGPAKEYEGRNGVCSIDLLNNFLTTTASAIRANAENRKNTPFAELRFGHESAILRFSQILDLITYENSTDKSGNIIWNTCTLCPMAANTIWQTFRCDEPDKKETPSYKIRMLVNERVTHFPIPGCQSDDGLCDWSTVEAHYRNEYRGITLEGVCGEIGPQYNYQTWDNN